MPPDFTTVPLNDWLLVPLEPEAEVAGSDVDGEVVEGDWDDWLELELDGVWDD